MAPLSTRKSDSHCETVKKSTMLHTVDWIRNTPVVHRSSAVNCNLRRRSWRGGIHCSSAIYPENTEHPFKTAITWFGVSSSLTYNILRLGGCMRGGFRGHGDTREFPAARFACLTGQVGAGQGNLLWSSYRQKWEIKRDVYSLLYLGYIQSMVSGLGLWKSSFLFDC